MILGLVLCVIAGAIAANMVASVLPHRSIHGIINILFGLLGGAGAWSFVSGLAVTYPPSLGALMLILAAGGIGGVATSLILGGLRNMVFGQPLQSCLPASPRTSSIE